MAKSAPLGSGLEVPQSPAIVAGVGCRRGTGADEIVALVEAALAAAGASPQALVAIGTLDRKAAEPGLLAAAARLGVPLRTFSADQLAASGDQASSKIQALVGVLSVAEATALRAGPLLLSKLKSARATCALSVARPDFDLALFGQAMLGGAPVSMATIASSRLLTSSAGP